MAEDLKMFKESGAYFVSNKDIRLDIERKENNL